MATAKVVAKHLFISDERLRQFRKGANGAPVIFPETAPLFDPKTKWNLTECRRVYLEHLRGVAGTKGNATQLTSKRGGLLDEQVRKTKLANDEKAGLVLKKSDVAQLYLETMVFLGQQLDALAGRLSDGNADKRTQILDETRGIRSNIADKLAEWADKSGPGNNPPAGKPRNKATAKARRVAVGRKQKAPAKGKR